VEACGRGQLCTSPARKQDGVKRGLGSHSLPLRAVPSEFWPSHLSKASPPYSGTTLGTKPLFNIWAFGDTYPNHGKLLKIFVQILELTDFRKKLWLRIGSDSQVWQHAHGLKWEDHLSPGVQVKPGQHKETHIQKKKERRRKRVK
jgi:hypothetical protein